MALSENRRSRGVRVVLWIAIACLAAITVYSLIVSGTFDRPPRVAFVVQGADPFFDIAVAGARDAAESFGARLEVFVPAQGADDQNRILNDAMNSGFDGIAVSPVNPAQQAPLLHRAAAKTRLVTFDADAPVSQRLCYVGTDNYGAGWICGELVREALPNGGKIMISTGSLDADNGQRRRQGIIDQLLDRAYGPGRPSEAVDQVLTGSKYTILGTLVDKDSRQSARETVLAAIKAQPDLSGLIGMYAFNGPGILDALKDAGKLGQIKVVTFDYDEDTLAGIEAGHVHGTVVQDPYAYGFHAVRILAELDRGEEGLPMFQTVLFDCKPVRKDKVGELRASLKQRSRGSKAGT